MHSNVCILSLQPEFQIKMSIKTIFSQKNQPQVVKFGESIDEQLSIFQDHVHSDRDQWHDIYLQKSSPYKIVSVFLVGWNSD